MAIINNTGLEGRDDLLGFTFNGRHSSEFRFIRVSGGKEFESELLPNRKDTTINIPGQMGEEFLYEKKEKSTFKFQFAFDDMNESDIREIKNWLSVDYPCDLVLDEEPYKTWKVKVSGIPKIKYNMFDREDGSRVYKGTGDVQFVAFKPYARCSGEKKNLNWGGYDAWGNKDQWRDTARLFNTNIIQQINNPNFLAYTETSSSESPDTFSSWSTTNNMILCKKVPNDTGIKITYKNYPSTSNHTAAARITNTVRKLSEQNYCIINNHKYYLTFSFRNCNLSYNSSSGQAYLAAMIGTGNSGDAFLITDYRDNTIYKKMLNTNFVYEYFFNATVDNNKVTIYTNYMYGHNENLLVSGSSLILDNVYLIDLTNFYNGQVPEDTNIIKRDLHGFSTVPIDSSVIPTPTGYSSYWNVYNAGDLPTQSKIILSYTNNNGYITVIHRQNNQDTTKIYLNKELLPSVTSDSPNYLTIDNNLHLILETTISDSTYIIENTVLNKALAGGDFFKIPPNVDKTDIQGIGVNGAEIVSIDYDYLYY